MNRALLADLQSRRAFPSITVLANTTPKAPLRGPERATLEQLVADADRRLGDLVSPELRRRLVDAARRLVEEYADEPAGRAIAICVSPEHEAVVRLGREVAERVVVDDTFATRDLVADLNRTAEFSVVTLSDRRVRWLLGDRHRLIEVREEGRWPLIRDDEVGRDLWVRTVVEQVRALDAERSLPVVVAGVQRTVRTILDAVEAEVIGEVPGNHDRTTATELHHGAWPLVVDWLRSDREHAVERLEAARSTRRFAGGLDEIWPLAHEGRVELIAVEDGYAVAGRLDGDHIVRVDAVSELDGADVIDDVLDELVETVMRFGGRAVMMGDGELADCDRVAAVLRY